ncbi:MAG: UTP--glucose-1-phosphate uridylyltransferase [Candidatus Altiarchaeales archaeon ex4484_96]|nr:MAG: UTP--glucose-1-phosphate uridylyltransferase [Candidatus Altiarchaeales archaeon ex4484_96]
MKAVIPAAGLGTRFLPATKAQPKEMLPLIDKPVIQFVVEEAVNSGIDDILIITGRGKRAIEDHFDKSFELEHMLEDKGKYDLLEKVRQISDLADIHYIRQRQAKGLGDAILYARKHVGNEPFVVLLGDDVIFSNKPCSRQLIDCYNKHRSSVIAVHKVPMEMIHHYGVIKGKKTGDTEYRVESLVEKPDKKNAPSNLAIIGRYILSPGIFEAIKKTESGKGGEIQLTDAINNLAQKEKVYALEFVGERYDMGNKKDHIKGTIQYALSREEFKQDTIDYIKSLKL